MKNPIVQVETKDKLTLHGLHLCAPDSDTVFLHTHGTASNFYEEDFVYALAERFLGERISMLSVNNRGAGVYDTYQHIGGAVEKFEDCLIDIDVWMEFAMKEGYKKIILSGHSLGTEKVVYYMNNGSYADKITALVFLAPSDSYGSHRVQDGKPNERVDEVKALLKEAKDLIAKGEGNAFLKRDAYGSRGGVMPKSAESFMNFLGPESKILDALPFPTGKLEAYSKIKIPILAVIGDGEEYTGIPINDALDLMKRENKNTQTVQIKDCDHDFNRKEKELADVILKFITGNR